MIKNGEVFLEEFNCYACTKHPDKPQHNTCIGDRRLCVECEKDHAKDTK